MKAGSVIWLTGLSGAGKSTISRELVNLFREQDKLPVLLDGDEVRSAIADLTCGHDYQSRLDNAWRICRLARLMAGQGHLVIVATVSLFHEVHKWNRENLPGYHEVFIDVDLETVRARDPKGLYSGRNEGQNMPGVDILPELPQTPHLHLKNDLGPEAIKPQARAILQSFVSACARM